MNFRLEDIADFQKGFAFKSKDFSQSGVKIVKVTNLTDESVDLNSCVHIDENLAKGYEQYSLQQDDIIITTVGSWPTNPASVVGKVVKVPKEGGNSLLNQNAVRVRSNGEVNQKYLYYLLRGDTFREYIIGTAQGSANQASITQKDIKSFAYDIPDMKIQDYIASVLSNLDKKIEVNNQINKTLETMTQEIFKHWFVDFEFPNENGEPYKSSGGEMVESELGMIPKGWKAATLGDIVVFNYGKALTSKDRVEGDVKVYSSAGHTGFHNKALVESDGIIVGRKGTIGTVYYARDKFYCIDTAYYITQKDCKIDLILVFQLLKQLKLKELNEDSAVPGLNRNTVYSQKIVLPTREIANRLSNILSSIITSMFHYNDENEILTKLRDTLLPKLMSGEIRVPLNN